MQKYHNYTQSSEQGSRNKITYPVFVWHPAKIIKECGRRRLKDRNGGKNIFLLDAK